MSLPVYSHLSQQLDIDFYYKRFHTYPDQHVAWITSSDPNDNDAAHPQFGSGAAYFNVIDIGQAYPHSTSSWA